MLALESCHGYLGEGRVAGGYRVCQVLQPCLGPEPGLGDEEHEPLWSCSQRGAGVSALHVFVTAEPGSCTDSDCRRERPWGRPARTARLQSHEQ